MKNVIVCKNCGTENPLYGLICTECKSYIREKIYNVDLWSVLGLLVEEPMRGFKQIIQSEHKNFIFFILIFASIKFTIDSAFLSLVTVKPEPIFVHFFRNDLFVLAGVAVILLVFSFLLKYFSQRYGVSTRIRDNFAVLTYSLTPQVFALIFLFIVELTVFGGNLFSKNPSPFALKEFLAYTLLGFELLIVIWGIYLSIAAVYTQTKNLLFSAASGIVFSFSIYFFLYHISLNLFD